jgi:hypothetical protein
LYGALPASLTALGVIKLPELKTGGAELFLPLLAVSLMPVLVLYVLLRQRLSAFYLLADGLTIRTSLMTVCILLAASFISGAAGIVHGRFEGIPFSRLGTAGAGLVWRLVLEAYLLGIATLVGSSTLFMTAVKEAGGLPGLPSSEFVKEIGALRTALAGIQFHDVWRSQQRAAAKELIDHLSAAKAASARLELLSPPRSGRRQLYARLSADLKAFDDARQQVVAVGIRWKELFAVECPRGLNELDRSRWASARTLKALLINA